MGVFLNENATERPLPYTHHQGIWSIAFCLLRDLPTGLVVTSSWEETLTKGEASEDASTEKMVDRQILNRDVRP